MNSPSTPWRLRRLTVVLFLLLTTALPARANAALQTPSYQEDFESGQADGWQLDSGWSVILDGTNHVLAGQGHTWAHSNQTFEGDMRLSFRVKLLQGRLHLVVRLSDASRYFIGFDTKGSDLNKQYFPDEFHNGLTGLDAAHSLNRWYQITIAFQGSRIEFLVDGVRQWSYTDPQALTGGSFAFETLDDSQAYVDDILVETGAGPAPTVTHAPAGAATAAKATPTTPANLTWVRTGGPLGGLGYDIRMRPDNPDIMYVTDAKAGVFKSTDGGNTWVPKNNGITTRLGTSSDEIPVFCLTIDPTNYDTIWVGTQWQRGFFKSTDAGETWKKMDNGVVERGLTTRGFGVDPHNSNVVYAAGEISSWEWAGEQRTGREFDLTKGVVYKTTDGGKNWQRVWKGDNVARYVIIDPRDTDVVYVSTGIFDREAANSNVSKGENGGVGVIKSTDGGKTWQQINNGLRNLYVGSLFMHPHNPDILLAGTGNAWGSPGAGVYLTTDGGQTWRQTLSVELMIESVEFSTANPQIAYAGGFLAIYRSEDGGLTWNLVSGNEEGWGSPGVMAGHPFDFQVDPRNPDRIFSNQYSGGNFLSLDGGRTWTSASKGYTGAAVRDIAVDPTQPGRVVVAARSGIFASFTGGEDWMGLSFPPFYSPDWHVVAIDPANPQHLIAGMTCWRNLVNSSDGGMSWHQTEQFPSGTQKAFADVAFASSDSRIVYAGSAGFISCGHFTSDVPSSGYNATIQKPGAGVFISHDGGEHWQQTSDPQMQNLAVDKLAVDPQDARSVYAATFYKGLFRSSDGGQSWSQVRGGLPAGKSITTVDIDPHDSNIIYAGRNQGGLYRSTDGGATWRQVAAGLPAEGVITDVEFDPVNPQVLYTTEVFSGVYRSLDGGKTWRALNDGLTVRSFNALAISSDGLHLYAASEGMGVFRLDLNGRPPQAAPHANPTPETGTATPYVYMSATATTVSGKKPLFNLPCGSALAAPLAVLGLVCWRASRKRIGK
jgi:photosystem II stability/assembly factor-like uncharacterized protein